MGADFQHKYLAIVVGVTVPVLCCCILVLLYWLGQRRSDSRDYDSRLNTIAVYHPDRGGSRGWGAIQNTQATTAPGTGTVPTHPAARSVRQQLAAAVVAAVSAGAVAVSAEWPAVCFVAADDDCRRVCGGRLVSL